MSNMQFANRTAQDVSLMRRFNEVAVLMDALAAIPKSNPIFGDADFAAAYATILDKGYVRVPRIINITRPEQAAGFDGSDFSEGAIKSRAGEGYRMAKKKIAAFQT